MDFSDLYRRYAGDVHRFTLFLSGDRTLAEDLTAETFARALVGRDRLRADTVKAYLFAIARNLYRDAVRTNARAVPFDDLPPPPDPAPGPDIAADDRRRLDAVLAAMRRLPDGEREALLLTIDHDLPYDRIAAMLGCSTAAVKVRVYRARLKLKALLASKELS